MPGSRTEGVWRACLLTGVLVSAAHLAIWVIVLQAHPARGSADSRWNLFPSGTPWHDAYAIVNAPVDLACERLAVRPRGGMSGDAERVASNALRLAAFGVWWFILGTGVAVASRALRRRSA